MNAHESEEMIKNTDKIAGHVIRSCDPHGNIVKKNCD